MIALFPSLQLDYKNFKVTCTDEEFVPYAEEYHRNLAINKKLSWVAHKNLLFSAISLLVCPLFIPVVGRKYGFKPILIVGLVLLVTTVALSFFLDKEIYLKFKALSDSGTIEDIALGANIKSGAFAEMQFAGSGRVKQLIYVLLLEKDVVVRADLATKALCHLNFDSEIAEILVDRFGARVDQRSFNEACRLLNYPMVQWMRERKPEAKLPASGGRSIEALESSLAWASASGIKDSPLKQAGGNFESCFPLEIMLRYKGEGASPLRALQALGLPFSVIQDFLTDADYTSVERFFKSLEDHGITIRRKGRVSLHRQIIGIAGLGECSSWEDALKVCKVSKGFHRKRGL